MAQLDETPAANAGAPSKLRLGGTEIPATTQLLAIAWLRWRMFLNSIFRQTRERKNAGLVLAILLRVIAWPIFAMWVIGPAFGSGFLAWMAIHDHHPQHLSALLAGIAVLWQFIAMNGASMAATLATFDPASLLRFPLRFGRYLVLRLMLGLLTPSTLVGCLALVGAFIGITVADASLAPAAFVVLAVYALMNLFFSRMVAAWMERWLATRRAREVFGALMALLVVGIQFVNFHRTPSHVHGQAAANGSWIWNLMQTSNIALNWLPPGFATQSILAAGHPLERITQFAALLASAALFFAALAYRLEKQFLGEYLSEGAPRAAAGTAPRSRPQLLAPPATRNLRPATSLLSPPLAACLRKEWIYLRGNSNQLIAMITPLIFVYILSRGILARHPSYLLSGAIGYAVVGLLAGLYNSFGADGAGVQLYLLAPIRLRDVIVAKNITAMALLVVESALAWCLVQFIATAPIPFPAEIATAFWVVFLLFTNLTLGTLRSILSPRKVALAQARALRTPPASRTSGLLILGIIATSILLQIPVTYLCHRFHNPWLAALIFAPLAAAAIAAYAFLLRNADRLILANRDTFAHELCGD